MAVIVKIPPSETNLAHAVSAFRFKLPNSSLNAILASIAATAQPTLQMVETYATVPQENSTSPSIQFLSQPRIATALLLPPTKHKEFAIAVFLITFTSK